MYLYTQWWTQIFESIQVILLERELAYIQRNLVKRKGKKYGLQVCKQGLTVNNFISRKCFVKEILQFLDPSVILMSSFPEIYQNISGWKLGHGHTNFSCISFQVSLSLTAIKWKMYQGGGISAVVLLGWLSYWFLELQNRKMQWRGRNIAKNTKLLKPKNHKTQEKERPGPHNWPGLKTEKAAFLFMKRLTVKIMPSLLI